MWLVGGVAHILGSLQLWFGTGGFQVNSRAGKGSGMAMRWRQEGKGGDFRVGAHRWDVSEVLLLAVGGWSADVEVLGVTAWLGAVQAVDALLEAEQSVVVTRLARQGRVDVMVAVLSVVTSRRGEVRRPAQRAEETVVQPGCRCAAVGDVEVPGGHGRRCSGVKEVCPWSICGLGLAGGEVGLARSRCTEED